MAREIGGSDAHHFSLGETNILLQLVRSFTPYSEDVSSVIPMRDPVVLHANPTKHAL